ncbi:hypothetical protein PVK06_036587 [Gossypium arboreum]|uniref:Phorbol-ester/DAG-type domain-containing protein n=1 Tax=Gossypium arboreum TaxID=29729 RepID=A0ABR0NJX2_GOSAR|nr:hypothetical protein PVK06_036587 [Gossypium arboreum]
MELHHHFSHEHSGCGELVSGLSYNCTECEFYLDKKCFEASPEVNHPFHANHSLKLLASPPYIGSWAICAFCDKRYCENFVYHCSCKLDLHVKCALFSKTIAENKIGELEGVSKKDLLLNLKSLDLLCQICHETHDLSPAYYCSACKFGLHVKCVSPAPTIKVEIHEHPFTLFWRQVPFICDAFGTSGDCISYICSPCGLIVDEKCILLQPIIERFPRHGHRISHTFIHRQHEIKSWKCRICYEEVNSKHGCYCCSDCNYIVHTNCGVKDYSWYDLVDDELEETSELLNNSAFVVIRETKLGENDVKPTEIKHLSHPHNLIFSNDVKDDKYCDGCVLFISTSVYHCAQCDILLHKSCAELPKKMYIWRHIHQRPFTLNLHAYFLCCVCAFRFNNCFSYDCNVCENRYCVEHRLFYYKKYEGQCNGCGRNLEYAFACKECNFFVEYGCLTLPDKIQHKCDEHPLMLTYGEDNIYSKYHYCDICEKEEIQAIGFTAVQFVTIQPMKIVFLMHTRI